ncbi:MAG: phosphotransferase family protein [Acidimicrobiales bacterium]|nr:phosphotransferase family protein [Acidimicrobiales bacterium]
MPSDEPEATADDDSEMGAPKFHKDRSAYNDALAAWYAKHYPDRSNITITDLDIPKATGFSNETVMFSTHWTDADGGEHTQRQVGRIEPPDGGMFPVQTPACAVSVQLQHDIMAAVAQNSAVPICGLVAFEPSADLLGQPFFVMDFIDGVVPADTPRYTEAGFLVDEATPAERRRLIDSGLGAMAGIHGIDWRAAGLDWLDASGTGEPTQAVQLQLYRDFCTAELDGRAHPVMDAALDWLVANDPHDERVGLSWGDARIGNIIWQDYQAAAVVDWEACALSPTEADVGWWLMFDRMSFDDIGVDRMEGYPTREEMIAIYEQASGREVRNPHYWEVFGAMRFAAIFIRLGDRLVQAGLVPEEMNPAVGNMVTEALAKLLDIENPTPSLI